MKKMIVGCNEYKLIDDICADPYFAKKFPPIITSAKKESPITF